MFKREITEEVREIRLSVDQQVESTMVKRENMDKRTSIAAIAKSSEVEVAEKGGARRRNWRELADDGDDGNADDEGNHELEDDGTEEDDWEEDDDLDEDEVRRVIDENRGQISS